MIRHADWPERLADFIETRRHQPFAWGTQDCCLFACDAVLEITGTDIAAAFRGTYDTALSAARILEDGGGIDGLVSAKLPTLDSALLQRGDLAMIEGGNGDTLGVCLGATIAAAGEEGLVFYPVQAATAAWRV